MLTTAIVSVLVVLMVVAAVAALLIIPIMYQKKINEREKRQTLSGFILQDPQLADSIRDYRQGKTPKPAKKE